MTKEPSKRGRPRKFSKELIAGYRMVYPEVRTEREIENKIYLGDAFTVIKDTELEPFFHDPEKNIWREGIMVELGKLEDPDLIYEIARQVVEEANNNGDHTVREWQKIIKIVRMDILRSRFQNSDEE